VVFPSKGTSYSTTVDLRPQTNFLVGVSASVDIKNGQTNWKFTTLDPATGQPPTDTSQGFLPPGGTGSVFFTVMPRQSLPTGTQIQNQASVIFDFNPSIATPKWSNTLDVDPPTSHVGALPVTENSSPFIVQWQGSDVGSGIQDYTLYVSDNGGSFGTWLTNTTSTQAPYPGVIGHTYSFYSIARDLVGNVEAAKTAAEATTTVQPGSPCASDISSQVTIARGGFRYNRAAKSFVQTVTLTNNGSPVAGASLVLDGLSPVAALSNSSGTTQCTGLIGSPFISIPGTLAAGQPTLLTLTFSDPTVAAIQYSTRILAGDGQK
jgi:hypothetical protein